MEPLWSPVVANAGTGRKSERAKNGRNKRKPLPWVATACRLERMVSVVSIRPLAKDGVTFLAPRESRVQAQRRARELDDDSNRPEVEKRWLSSSALAGADQVTTTASTSHALLFARVCTSISMRGCWFGTRSAERSVRR